MATVTRFPQDGRRVRLSPDAAKAAWTSDQGLHLNDRLRVPEAVVEELLWSPDGSGVAASLADPDAGHGGHRRVRWVPEYVGDESRSTPGASFAWEPRGVWLVVADPWTGEIRRLNTETGKESVVCAVRDQGDPLRAPALAVSPDGKRLAFSAMLEDLVEVRIVELPAGRPELLTQLPRTSIRAVPFWSPDSRSLGLLAVDLEEGKSGLIVVKDLKGEGEIVHSCDFILPPHVPAWSPSGKRLAFLDVEAPDHPFTKAGPARVALLENGGRRGVTPAGEVEGDVRFLSEDRLVVDGGPSAWLLSL